MAGKEPVVFVVDEDPVSRESLAVAVRSRGMAVETHASGEDFLEAFDPSRLSCLVTELQLPGISGLGIQEKLQSQGIELPVIIVTAEADIPTAVRAIQTGAVTFLEKPCSEDELWANIHDGLERYRDARQALALKAELEARLSLLTPGEREVMERVVAGKPNKIIASELEIGLRTVELRRAKIYRKMESRSVAELVRMHLAIGQGDGPEQATSSSPPSDPQPDGGDC